MDSFPNKAMHARALRARYRDTIPADLLERLIDDALSGDNLPPDERDTYEFAPPREIVVYGVAAWGDYLVFMPLSQALAVARGNLNFSTSRTWGEFFHAEGESAASWYREKMLDDMEHKSFEGFLDARTDEEPQLTRDEVWKEYVELSPVSERLPFDDEEFVGGHFTEWLEDHGVHPESTQATKNDCVPREIVDEFGEIESGMWDGPWVNLMLADKNAILARYRELGYVLIEDEELTSMVDSIHNDAEGALAHIRRYEIMQEQLREVVEGKERRELLGMDD